MSPRAAWRLERLGFQEVYDYVLGKADWLAAGLPTEGSGHRERRAVDVVDRSVPTCGPGEALQEVTARARAAEWDSCVVVNERQIVLGRLRLDRIDQAAETAVEDMMEPGPPTVRADADARQTVERLRGGGSPTSSSRLPTASSSASCKPRRSRQAQPGRSADSEPACGPHPEESAMTSSAARYS